MAKLNKSFDWTEAQAFLETAETGSFSAAAEKLGLSQPTIGRHVSALEGDLGVALFDRVGRSLVLTDNGLHLLEYVRSMRDAADQLTLTAMGNAQSVAGKVTITASDAFCAYTLPEIVLALRHEHPEIEIEVFSSDEVQDLRRREADIAIRHGRPNQPDLIAKRLINSSAHLYGTKQYLDQIGRPKSPDDIGQNVQFIGFENSDRIRLILNGLGFNLTPDQFMVTTNNAFAGWEMMKKGIGLTLMIKDVADQTESAEMILADYVDIELPVWLVTHRELHTSRRIRIVYNFIAQSISSPR
ncbi:LysR family transcriptional regulator [Thalassospira lucentensis]|uniref:LysR family transcriptional regulator n=1 Tax=Thalassospira lucentensis TaxID=168935 RepID=UPI003D2EE84A